MRLFDNFSLRETYQTDEIDGHAAGRKCIYRNMRRG